MSKTRGRTRAATTAMAPIEYLDRPPPGWFVLDVMRKESPKWDWAALMVDVHPDDLKNCACDFPALFYVHPKEYRPVSAKHSTMGPRSGEAQGQGCRLGRS